jgi:hypothetical protein
VCVLDFGIRSLYPLYSSNRCVAMVRCEYKSRVQVSSNVNVRCKIRSRERVPRNLIRMAASGALRLSRTAQADMSRRVNEAQRSAAKAV